MKKYSLHISIVFGIGALWGISSLPESLHYLYWVAGGLWGLCYTYAVVNKEVICGVDKVLLGSLVVLHLSAIFSGAILEDDFYRYSWDGRNIRQGVHPYEMSPYEQVSGSQDDILDLSFDDLDVDEELKSFPAYTDQINYPMYRTVYPPLCELLFSSEALIPDTIFGWPVLIAIVDLCFIFFLLFKSGLSQRLSYLLLANPLLVKEGLNSLHFDFMLVPLLFLFLYGSKKHSPFVLGLISGIRPWYLALLLWRWKIWTLKEYGVFVLSLLGPWVIMVLLPGFPSEGLSSWGAFVKDWEFNAVFFEIIRQFCSLLTYSEFYFRVICWFLGFGAIAYVRYKSPKSAWGLVAIAGWLLFLPTVNPWYFMPVATVLVIHKDVRLRAFSCALTVVLPLAYMHYRYLVPGTMNALLWSSFEIFLGVFVYRQVCKVKQVPLLD